MAYPFVQLNAAVYEDRAIKDVDVRVLGVMVAEAGEKRTFRKLRRWVATKIGKSEHVVADSWKRLESAGYIRRDSQGQKFAGGAGKAPTFTIEPAASPPTKAVQKSTRQPSAER